MPLEDPSMTDYDLGVKVFSAKAFRPKSASKFRTKNKLKSHHKFSRMSKFKKERELDSYSPSRVYDTQTDNENSFMKVNKSINSLRETPEGNDNSVYNSGFHDLKTKY
mmetsp:Transcript_28294/g.25005  ORF Transcript_28294/g.25005 Transcript_28294/m.25005 type:complete len:108 (+) Transcript_28294:192-515(+)